MGPTCQFPLPPFSLSLSFFPPSRRNVGATFAVGINPWFLSRRARSRASLSMRFPQRSIVRLELSITFVKIFSLSRIFLYPTLFLIRVRVSKSLLLSWCVFLVCLIVDFEKRAAVSGLSYAMGTETLPRAPLKDAWLIEYKILQPLWRSAQESSTVCSSKFWLCSGKFWTSFSRTGLSK